MIKDLRLAEKNQTFLQWLKHGKGDKSFTDACDCVKLTLKSIVNLCNFSVKNGRFKRFKLFNGDENNAERNFSVKLNFMRFVDTESSATCFCQKAAKV